MNTLGFSRFHPPQEWILDYKTVCVICRDIDEYGEHYSQQTDTRTENGILHILTHRRVMKNENTWTQGGEYKHWGLLGGIREGQWGVGSLGEIA